VLHLGAFIYEIVWYPEDRPQGMYDRRLRDIVRYEAPAWEHVESVGNVTTTTLKVSKDNVVFAVRAVDKAGRRSLPVVPVPER
jgi:hypothetical protein